MLRKVVESDTYRPERTAPGSFAIRDTLECGHVVTVKGSAGRAFRRNCKTCDHLKNGGKSWTGGIQELWDEKTQMPYWENS